jgi:hypothetical protein
MDVEFARIRDELPRDRIGRIGWIDERRQRRRNRDGVALNDAFDHARPFGGDKARSDEVGR